MDILKANDMKQEVRVVLWYLKRKLRKEYGVTLEEMENDLNTCGNPVVALLWKTVKETSSNIKENHQKSMINDFIMVALWIAYKDTAYNTPFMYMIKKVLDGKDKLSPYVDKYYKEPDSWYVNIWHDTKEHTKKMKEDGVLLNAEAVMSPDEEIFVPRIQDEKWKKLDEEIKRRRKLYDRGKVNHKDMMGEVDA